MIVLRELSKKEFKELKKETNNQVSIVGETILKKYNEDKHEKYDFVEYDDNNNKKYLVKQDYWGFKNKYLDIGDNKFVLVRSRAIIIILFILLLIGICPLSSWLLHQEDSPLEKLPIVGEMIEEYNNKNEQVQEYIKIPGLQQVYTISSSKQELYLINPESNTVYFKYIISEGDSQIYESDYLQPNKMIKVNLYELLDSGEHSVSIKVLTKDIETQADCNSAVLKTKIVVK